jgi:hypothetical protein
MRKPEVNLHSFLTSALDGDFMFIYRPCPLDTQYPLSMWRGSRNPTAGPDTPEKPNILMLLLS